MTETTSQVSPGKSVSVAPGLRPGTKRAYRRKGLDNLLRMGHCAPSVMQTLNDLGNSEEDWLVRMTAGLPGGIGSTGFECGGITSPLIQFGLDYGLQTDYDGLPSVISAWHNYAGRFVECNNSLFCKDILGDRRVPLPCIKMARHAPELYRQTDLKDNTEALSGGTREAYCLLNSHMAANDFHCAHAVLKHLGKTIPLNQALLNATSGFIGGTALSGLTCSALAAGIMAVGLKLGEIENSYLRVFRMLTIMVAGGDAFADHLNKFNRVMNIGHKMAKWFRGEFGSTLCHEITHCEFSSKEDVQKYIGNGSVNTCKAIAEKVARQAEMFISQKGAEAF